jgi:hypothetical protein
MDEEQLLDYEEEQEETADQTKNDNGTADNKKIKVRTRGGGRGK